MHAARAEVHRLRAEREKVYGPVEKKKSGRPSIWRGPIGQAFVEAVEETIIKKLREGEDEEEAIDLDDPEVYGSLQRAERVHAHRPKGSRRLYNLAQAIRKAVRTHPLLEQYKEVFGRLSDRALQARYQQAADCWSKARREPRDQEREAAMDRWEEATEEFRRWRDARDSLDD